MSGNIFDLEQQILNCWNVTDDIKIVCETICDDPFFSGLSPQQADKISNILIGLSELYAIKFERTFNTFEKVCAEYHSRQKHTFPEEY